MWISSASRTLGRINDLAYPDFLDYRDATRDVFSGMFAFRSTPLNIGTGEPQRVRGQRRFDDELMGERKGVQEARISREVEAGDEAGGMAVGIDLVHRPAGMSAQHAVDRQAVLVAPHQRRPGEPNSTAADDELVARQPVRPRMKERHPHDGAALAVTLGSRVAGFVTHVPSRMRSVDCAMSVRSG